MPRKDFAAFTRLDASDVNTYLMDQAVQTFAGTAARGSAITTPVEGMVTYLEDLDRYDTYNGSSHVPMGGLTLVKSQTVGSAVASVTVDDAFSADYDNYLVTMQNVSASATNLFIRLRLGSTATGYKFAITYSLYGGAVTNATSAAAIRWGYVGSTTTNSVLMSCSIFQPFLARNTCFAAPYADEVASGFAAGVLLDTTSYTSFLVDVSSSGTLTGGTINVYGYKKA
jgi:hypothetical protein